MRICNQGAYTVTHEPTPTVLIVDDEPALADGHAAQLESYNVRTAYDGEAAMGALDSTVDIVLLDRRMPGLSGDEVLDRIRERNIDCRVVMLTGVEPAVDIISMGFDEYLQKPVSGKTLQTTVERIHRRSSYNSKLQEFFSLASKRATLETEYEQTELEGESSYGQLCERLETVQKELDDVLAKLPEEDRYLVATDDPTDVRADS